MKKILFKNILLVDGYRYFYIVDKYYYDTLLFYDFKNKIYIIVDHIFYSIREDKSFFNCVQLDIYHKKDFDYNNIRENHFLRQLNELNQNNEFYSIFENDIYTLNSYSKYSINKLINKMNREYLEYLKRGF